ncbi:hypothetical protein F2981_23350 (plasmid) [Sinorhizobium meliloti]|nr:hypothetical protein [Sinorhizobium meliloti]
MLYFAETLEECRAAALEQRQELKEGDPTTSMKPMAMLPLFVRMPDQQTCFAFERGKLAPSKLVSLKRKLVALVTE